LIIWRGYSYFSPKSNDDDPTGFADKSEYLLRDWITIYHTPTPARDPLKTFSMFVNKMNIYGILKGDDPLTRFFRHATQLCIDYTYRSLNEPNLTQTIAKTKVFQWIDAFVRLIALLVKHSGENGNQSTKLNLLNKVSVEVKRAVKDTYLFFFWFNLQVLGIVVGILLQDQDLHGTQFQQLGYHRIFIMLFLELSAHDPILENISLSVSSYDVFHL
jgi:CCR4-NOT transcription complex subunit 1